MVSHKPHMVGPKSRSRTSRAGRRVAVVLRQRGEVRLRRENNEEPILPNPDCLLGSGL